MIIDELDRTRGVSLAQTWRRQMEFGQVEAFLAVGNFGGFRRAADALRLTQPAVSARIKALEHSLGVPLFERGRGPAAAVRGGPRAAAPRRATAPVRGPRPPGRPRHSAGRRRSRPHRRRAVDLHVPAARRAPALPGGAPARDDHRPLRPLQGSPRHGAARGVGHRARALASASRRGDAELAGRSAHAGGPGARVAAASPPRPAGGGRPIGRSCSSTGAPATGRSPRACSARPASCRTWRWRSRRSKRPRRWSSAGWGWPSCPISPCLLSWRGAGWSALEIVDAEPLARSLDVIHPRQRPLTAEAQALLATVRATLSRVPAPRPRRR